MEGKKCSRQQLKKLIDGKCFFCGETNYALLDAHRIIMGGTYNHANVLTTCSNCHRRIHSGEITVERKYNSTAGRPVVHYWEKGEEFWVME